MEALSAALDVIQKFVDDLTLDGGRSFAGQPLVDTCTAVGLLWRGLAQVAFRETLTRPDKSRDPRPMKGEISASEGVAKLKDLGEQLTQLQPPVVAELDLFLCRLPALKFESVDEKIEFGESLADLLTRLDRRVRRFDASKPVDLKDVDPSDAWVIRCNKSGKYGYLRLERHQDGQTFQDQLESPLPPLTSVPKPPDPRKRAK